MSEAVDLEIELHRKDSRNWAVEFRCTVPGADTDVRLERSGRSPDLAELRGLADDDEGYGELLGRRLFAIPEMHEEFEKARAVAETHDLPLRFRLFIGSSVGHLHGLRWETMRVDGEPLFTSERVLFSRYLSSLDWRPVAVRPKTRLRALVVVANPSDLPYQDDDQGLELAPIRVSEELERARHILGARSQVTELASPGSRPTLANLMAHLLDGVDILYVVCHGYIAGEEPQLLLETAQATTDLVQGSHLVHEVKRLQRPPMLVVFASCQSAGAGEESRSTDGGALVALGPRLAEAGVPAVVAMQGDVFQDTLARFMPVFFNELDRDGQIDRAMAVARSAVKDRSDWWAPTLFMRLKSGRIWYKPGFADDFEKWPAILRHIRSQKCTPILGPGLTDALLGTRQELAWSWSQRYHFPMASHDREDLTQVAQFLSVNQDDVFLRDELADHVRRELRSRYPDLSPNVLSGSLDELVSAAGERLRAIHPAEPHKVLATLPFKVYLTTHPSNLLRDALEEAGKEPVVDVCRWSEDFEWPPPLEESHPGYVPDVQHPLVFHLFGRLQDPESVVLTENDFLDFLVGMGSQKDLIPSVVRSSLTNGSLLFLGFRMDEWDFRVLFRSIMRQQGAKLRDKYSHAAVQVDPEESRTLEPERARRYLQRYFGEKMGIYWGSVEDFVRELGARWESG